MNNAFHFLNSANSLGTLFSFLLSTETFDPPPSMFLLLPGHRHRYHLIFRSIL
jgi:hypothetical protein